MLGKVYCVHHITVGHMPTDMVCQACYTDINRTDKFIASYTIRSNTVYNLGMTPGTCTFIFFVIMQVQGLQLLWKGVHGQRSLF